MAEKNKIINVVQRRGTTITYKYINRETRVRESVHSFVPIICNAAVKFGIPQTPTYT